MPCRVVLTKYRYAEVLESTQLTLIATIQKLYLMVRSGQSWELGEPDFNNLGLPIVHKIAEKLGCIRLNSDVDLPACFAFPEDHTGMAELAIQLDQRQHSNNIREGNKSNYSASSMSDRCHSDLELDSHNVVFDYYQYCNVERPLPQHSTGSRGKEFGSPRTDSDQDALTFTSQTSPLLPVFAGEEEQAYPTLSATNSNAVVQCPPRAGEFQNVGHLYQEYILQGPKFGSTEPEALTPAVTDVMMGVCEYLILSNSDTETYL